MPVAVELFGKASSPFCTPDNVKINKYTHFDKNIPCGSRVMSVFTNWPRQARRMLCEASSRFCIPVARQC